MPKRPRQTTRCFSELENPHNSTPVEEYVSARVARFRPDRTKARPAGKPPGAKTCAAQQDALWTALRLYRKGLVTAGELAANWGVDVGLVEGWLDSKKEEM